MTTNPHDIDYSIGSLASDLLPGVEAISAFTGFPLLWVFHQRSGG